MYTNWSSCVCVYTNRFGLVCVLAVCVCGGWSWVNDVVGKQLSKFGPDGSTHCLVGRSQGWSHEEGCGFGSGWDHVTGMDEEARSTR